MIDQNAVLSDSQAITATAASTNSLNLSNMPWAGRGEPLMLDCRVVEEDFATLTSLTVALESSANGSTGWTVEYQTAAIAAADLVVGKKIGLRFLPNFSKDRPYLRLYYTVAGSNATAGKIWAHIGIEEMLEYEDGLFFSPRNPTGDA